MANAIALQPIAPSMAFRKPEAAFPLTGLRRAEIVSVKEIATSRKSAFLVIGLCLIVPQCIGDVPQNRSFVALWAIAGPTISDVLGRVSFSSASLRFLARTIRPPSACHDGKQEYRNALDLSGETGLSVKTEGKTC